MIKVNSKYPTKIKFVEHKSNDHGQYTTFNIGDIIKDSEPRRYINYRVTVYEHLDIKDGDEVTLTEIDSISTSESKGKDYHNIVGKVKVNGSEPPFEL